MILCQSRAVKKLDFPCGERLWISLWKMWKTPSYQQVFRLFTQKPPGVGKMEDFSPEKKMISPDAGKEAARKRFFLR